MLDSNFLFQVNHIITVRGELLAAVRSDPLPALFLEGRGKSLGLFLALFSVQVGETSKVAVQGFNCFPSAPRPRWARANGVGDQFAFFIPSLLNACHLATLRSKVLPILMPYPVLGAVVTMFF